MFNLVPVLSAFLLGHYSLHKRWRCQIKAWNWVPGYLKEKWGRSAKRLRESHAGFFPNLIVRQTIVCLSLDGDSDKVRENIGPSSEEWNLEPRQREIPQTHTHAHTHKNTAAYTEVHTELDTVKGIQSQSTGYDTRSSEKCSRLVSDSGTDWQFQFLPFCRFDPGFQCGGKLILVCFLRLLNGACLQNETKSYTLTIPNIEALKNSKKKKNPYFTFCITYATLIDTMANC